MATKEGKLCPHIFKCMNYKGDYQADSYSYPYWHNYFNRDWHSKKQQELFFFFFFFSFSCCLPINVL